MNTIYKNSVLFILLLLAFGTASAQPHMPQELSKKETEVPMQFPLNQKDFQTISSPFGYRMHPIHKEKKLHTGIDLVAPKGAAVYATASGTVEKATFQTGYGNHITIRHNQNLKTLYAHLWINLVKKGDTIYQGQPIGMVGATGMATGAHLHYEVHMNSIKIDPVLLWKILLQQYQKNKA